MKKLGYTISVFIFIALMSVLVYNLFRSDLQSINKNNEKIYATDLTISADFRSLTLYLGNSLRFTEIPYSVKPKDYNQGVEVKIFDHNGNEKESAKYIDNCFTATETGVHYIRFIVKTKYDTTKHDTIKISVVNKLAENCKIVVLSQSAKTITTNETLNIADYVTVYNLGLSTVGYYCNTGKISGSIFTPTEKGTFKIEVAINCENYLIFDIFTIVVSSDKSLNIILYDITNTKIECGTNYYCSLSSNVVLFSYMVEGLNNQLIKVEIENEKIVSLISKDAPLIILELTGTGETEIIIKIPNNFYEFSFKIIVE